MRRFALIVCLCVASAAVAAEPASGAADFAAINQQWTAALQQIGELKQKYAAAPADQRPAIIEQFNATVAKLRELAPARRDAAVAAYKAAPNANAEVTATVVEVLDGEIAQDHYDEAAAIAALLIEHKHADPAVHDLAGRAAFARNEFDAAERHWQAAAAANALSEQSQRYVGLIGDYKKWWAEETAKRTAEAATNDLPRVKLTTSKGEITIELFENEAPNTVANFIELVEKSFYDGTVFHRVIPGFMAQGGDPTGTGRGGPGHAIACECHQPNFRRHFRGTLSMAHAGRDTGGSQFFLTFLPTPHLDGKHTAFGRVIEGLDVLAKLQRLNPGDPIEPDKIVKAEVLRKREHKYEAKKLPGRE